MRLKYPEEVAAYNERLRARALIDHMHEVRIAGPKVVDAIDRFRRPTNYRGDAV